MSRDEILAEIERLSWMGTGSPSLATLAVNMRRVVELAGQYHEVEYDRECVAEAVLSALGRYADMIEVHAL